MIPDNQYENLVEALQASGGRGYRKSFIYQNGELVCRETRKTYHSSEIYIESFHRMEGNSDPGDSSILYLLETIDGTRGTLVDAFGPQSNPELDRFLKQVTIDRSESLSTYVEKTCLNCGTVLLGKYCHRCGQHDENLRQSVWHLITHAVSDYWHFDSKFFKTLKPLFIKPGYLTAEYFKGRRASYVNPVRLYLFISVVFFLFYFTLFDRAIFTDDAFRITRSDTVVQAGQTNSSLIISETEGETLPLTIQQYDDSVKNLPPDQRPGWFNQLVSRKMIDMKQKGQKQFLSGIADDANHNLPKMMFVMIPVFALGLKLVYIRRRIYFVDHAIFTLHIHSFIFLLLLGYFLVLKIVNQIDGDSLGIMILLLWLYLFIAMKHVYRQSFGKTLLKEFLLVIFYTIGFGILMIVNLLFSFLFAH